MDYEAQTLTGIRPLVIHSPDPLNVGVAPKSNHSIPAIPTIVFPKVANTDLFNQSTTVLFGISVAQHQAEG
jgi:hypothetical protein